MIDGGVRSRIGSDAAAGALKPGEGMADLVDEFRRAMRRIAATVTIITIADGEDRFGVTATSVTSVAMAPPSLLVCLHRQGQLCSRLAPSRKFCVNVLKRGQEDLSRIFAGGLPHDERFGAFEDWLEDDGVPFFPNAQCSVFCETAQSFEWGTHTIFVGAVRKVRVQNEVVPLVYCDGGFRELKQAACATAGIPG